VTFQSLLRRLLRKHFKTVRDFAESMNMDPSHMSRAMGRNGQPFDVTGCLRLAEVTGERPGAILRAAGKADLAERIERLYGPAAPVILTPQQQVLLQALDGIDDPAARDSLITIARYLAERAVPSAGSEGGEGGGPVVPPAGRKDPGYKMGQHLRHARR
jgi:hypothetical protein